MASVLYSDWVVCIQVLAVDTVLCSWVRHLTLPVPLSTQVYKWEPLNTTEGSPVMH